MAVSAKAGALYGVCPMALALGVVLLNLSRLPEVRHLHCGGGVQPGGLTGGAVGSLFLSMQKGVSRGIFPTKWALAPAPLPMPALTPKSRSSRACSASWRFADTIVICTLTALVIPGSGTSVNYGQAAGAELTISGFTSPMAAGHRYSRRWRCAALHFLPSSAGGCNGSRCIEYLFHTDKVVRPFLVVLLLCCHPGATVDLGLLWSIADTFNGLMSIPNLDRAAAAFRNGGQAGERVLYQRTAVTPNSKTLRQYRII